MSRRNLGLSFAGLALVSVVAGGGGFRAGPVAVFELCALAAAALAASLPARPGPAFAGALGGGLAAVTLVSAALAPYRFASLDRWAIWSAALLLAWSISRLERAAGSSEEGRVSSSRFVALATLSVLMLQIAGELGVHPGGAPERVSGGSLHGSFASANHLSELLVLLVLGSLPFVSLRTPWGRCHAALAGAAALGVALGSSRIAPVALALGLGVWLVGRSDFRRLSRPALILGSLAGVLLLGASARIIVTRSGEGDAWRRPRIWAAVAPAALERPLLGLGPGSYRHAHHPYNFPVETRVGRYGSQPATPHGEWLRLPIELGLLGCSLLGLLLLARLRGGRSRGAWPLVAALLPLAAVHDFLQAPAVAAWTAAVFVICSEREDQGVLGPALVSGQAPQRTLALALAAAVGVSGLVLRPTFADRAARSGDASASLAWSAGQPYRWLRAGEQAAAGRPAPERMAAAMLFYEEAGALGPRLPEPPQREARLLADATLRFRPDEAGRDAAAQAWDRAAALSPYDPKLLLEQAVFLVQTGAPERARLLSERALELEPHFTDAALVALIAARGAGRDAAGPLARVAESLAALPRLRLLVTNDYERALIEPDERLLEVAGLRDGSS